MLNSKKSHFKDKLNSVKRTIWDMEFKKYKTQEIREGIRQEYDNLKGRLSVLEEQIKSQTEKPTMEEGEIKKLDDQKAILVRDIERYENQIKGLDIEVYGSKPTNEYPDGVSGLDQQIDALQELQGMIKSYIKEL